MTASTASITQRLFDQLISEEIAISMKMISEGGRPAVEFAFWPDPAPNRETKYALAVGLSSGLFRLVPRRAGWYRVEVA